MPQPHPGSALEVLGVATRLGVTSFGGPIAHLGYFGPFDILTALSAVEMTLVDLGHKLELGSGVRVAEQVLRGGK